MEPESRVRELVIQYEAIEVLHPMVSGMGSDHLSTFEKSLNMELSLIRSRSDLLIHSEISIVQKAFMILMNDPEHHVGGIELYVEEIIGLKLVAAEEQRVALQTAVNARSLLLNNPARNPQLAPRSYGRDHSQMNEEGLFLSPGIVIEKPKAQDRPASVSSYVKLDSAEHVTLPVQDFNFDSDPNFNRLWRVFENARADLNSQNMYSHNMYSHQRNLAARFLRDTIENVMHYIKHNHPSGSAILNASSDEAPGIFHKLFELRSSHNQAAEAVKTAYGGRLRTFDELDVPGEASERQIQGSSASRENVGRQPELRGYHRGIHRPVRPRRRPRFNTLTPRFNTPIDSWRPSRY